MRSDDIDIKILIICIVIIFPVLLIISAIYEGNYKIYYTYVDLDNNEGIADECEYTDKSIASGGMGTPICELEDGTVIAVKQYKRIRESKGE